MSEGPDKVVKETEIRTAVDRIAGGLADNFRQVGKLPPGQELQDWAAEQVANQVAVHEERCRNGVPEAASTQPVEKAKTRDDDAITERPVGTFEWDTKTNEFTAVGPVAKKFANRKPRLINLALKARLDFLRQFPEWDQRVLKAFHEGAWEAIKLGRQTGHMNPQDIAEKGAEYVMKVVEASNAVFGDWENPKEKAARIYSK